MQRWLVVVAFMAIFCAVASQAESAALTLDDCFQAALQRSEILADQKELVIQAEEHYQQARGSVLPTVTGIASYLRQDDSQLSPANAAFFPAEQQVAEIRATQPLFRGFREFAALREAKKIISAQQAARDWAGLQLYLDVSQAFYNVLALQADVNHMDAQLGLFAQRIQELKERVAVGRSRPSEVLTIQTAQATLRAQRFSLQGQLRVAREILAFLTGLEAMVALVDTETPPGSPEPEDLYVQKIENRPDVLTARERVEANREGVRIASGEHWPNLDATGNYYLNRSGAESPVKWDAQIDLTLPVFFGGQITSRTRAAESVQRQSENDLSLVRRSALQDIHTFRDNLVSDLTQIEAYEEAANLSAQNYKAVLKDYNLGLITNLDVLEALNSSQDALRALDHARYTAKLDFIRLATSSMQRVQALAPAGGEKQP
jgi:outer membrane protein